MISSPKSHRDKERLDKYVDRLKQHNSDNHKQRDIGKNEQRGNSQTKTLTNFESPAKGYSHSARSLSVAEANKTAQQTNAEGVFLPKATFELLDTPKIKYSGWVLNGLREGEGSLWSCVEDRAAGRGEGGAGPHEYHGHFVKGEKKGKGTHIFPDDSKLTCSFVHGCPDGMYIKAYTCLEKLCLYMYICQVVYLHT